MTKQSMIYDKTNVEHMLIDEKNT